MRRLWNVLIGVVPALVLRFGSAGLSFLLVAVAARIMAPENFAAFSVAFATAMAAALLGQCGQVSMLFKYYDPDTPIAERGPAVKSALVISGIAAIGLSALGLLGLVLVTEQQPLFRALAAGLVLAGPYTLSEVLQGYWRMRQRTTMALLPRDIVWRAMSIAAVVWLGTLLPVSMVVLALAGLLLVCCLPQAVVMLRRERGFWQTKLSIDTKQILTLQGVNFSDAVFFYGDVLIIGALATGAEVAVYAAAARIAQVLLIAQQAVETTALPRVALHIRRGERAQASAVARQNARLGGGLCLLGALVILGTSPLVLHLFGPHYAGAAGLIAMLMVVQVVVPLAGNASAIMVFAGFERLAMWFNLATSLVFVLVGAALTLAFGPWGLAVARTSVYGVAAIIRSVVVHRRTGINPMAIGMPT